MLHRVNAHGLTAVLRSINALRSAVAAGEPVRSRSAESIVELLFSASQHLATYGSLWPGGTNHGVVADIHGEWVDGVVRGMMHDAGWGALDGYPGMTWNPAGDSIAVKVLCADSLPTHWQRLDEFEGPAYRRVLVPVETSDGGVLVANIYEVRV